MNMSMKTYLIKRKSILPMLLVFLCFGLKNLDAQTYTAQDKFMTLSQNDIYVDTLFSSVDIRLLNSLVDPLQEAEIKVVEFNPGWFQLTFSFSKSGFLGKKMFEVHTFAAIPTISKAIRYNFTIVKSKIVAKDDYVKLGANDKTLSIDPLINDVFNDNFQKKLIVTDVKYGRAWVENGLVKYEVPLVFENDVILYTVSNYTGANDQGAIYIYKDLSINQNRLTNFTVSDEASYQVVLPRGLKSFLMNPSKGSLEVVNENVVIYKPSIKGKASDKFIVSFGQNYYTYNVSIIDSELDKGFVKDDIIYTGINQSIVFNVFDNDLTTANLLINHSPELEYLGKGRFKFTPSSNFIGVKKLFYETGNRIFREIGAITMNVGNIEPSSDYLYEIDVLKGQSHIFSYETPLDGYTISINTLPKHGAASAFKQTDPIELACGFIKGKAVVSYYPIPGYVGKDEFTVKYCIGSSPCKTYKLTYNVIDKSSSWCDCGVDCVYPGDANADGMVSPLDLLAIGRNYGKIGEGRATLSTDNFPKAAMDWSNQLLNGKNIKHSDVNGDGVVDRSDVNGVIQNLGKINALIPSKYGNSRVFPIKLVPNKTEVDSGDLIMIDVYVGDDTYPILDAYGLGFNLNFNSGFLDSASVKVSFPKDSWFADQSPLLDFFKMSGNGTLTSALSRTKDEGISGIGKIGTVTGVIKDRIEGFKDDDSDFIIHNIFTSDVQLEQNNGNIINGGKTVLPIKVNRKKSEKVVESDDLIIFPNPSRGDFTISLNGQDAIQSINIYDMGGKLVSSHSNIGEKQFYMVNPSLANGLYIVKVKSNTNTLVKRLSIVDRF